MQKLWHLALTAVLSENGGHRHPDRHAIEPRYKAHIDGTAATILGGEDSTGQRQLGSAIQYGSVVITDQFGGVR